MPKILVLEDDKEQLNDLVTYLETWDFEVIQFDNLKSAKNKIKDTIDFDLAIVDVMLDSNDQGNKDGFRFAKELRLKSKTIPIIFITALESDMNMISGQKIVCWNYIVKPYNPELVRTSIHSALEYADGFKTDNLEAQDIVYGDLIFRRSESEVEWKGKTIEPTITESLILSKLLVNPGIVINTETLLDHLIESDNYSAVHAQIKNIKKKFKTVDPEFDRIKTIYGAGYKWVKDS
ncbi:MAG: response regulator transcription factor [Nitrospinota bacterium]|nr:response regulator transcription factor [Nitrospinota bacterium]